MAARRRHRPDVPLVYTKSRVWPSGEMAGYRSHNGEFSAAGAADMRHDEREKWSNFIASHTHRASRKFPHSAEKPPPVMAAISAHPQASWSVGAKSIGENADPGVACRLRT